VRCSLGGPPVVSMMVTLAMVTAVGGDCPAEVAAQSNAKMERKAGFMQMEC